MDKSNESTVDRVLRYIARLEDGFLVFLLSLMIGLSVLQIILRNVFQSGFTDGESLARILVLWVGMLGAVVASRERKHISIDILSRYVNEKPRQYVEVLVDVFVVFICSLLATHSMRMLMVDYEANTTAFANIPTWVLGSILPVAFGIITLRYLIYSWQGIRVIIRGRAT